MKKIIGAVFVVLLSVSLLGAFLLYPSEKQPESEAEFRKPVFEKIALPFQNNWTPKVSHSLVASAAIDINGDGADEIFIGGSDGQNDALLRWQEGGIVNITSATNLGDQDATYGAVSIDIDGNGSVDLLTVGNNGLIIWLNDDGKFEPMPVDITFPENAVAVDIAATDFDRDGDVDIYLSMFVDPANFRSPVFNDPNHARPNLLLRNDGNFIFTDVTDAVTAGLQNTFVSSFVDLNADGLQDLVLAQNTGQIEILKGLGEHKFEKQSLESGFGFWMGLALADIDADGDIDLFFSNIGNSIPSFVLQGDIQADQNLETEWLLLRNDGDFKFTDVTELHGLTGFGFGWGSSFTDINLDGVMDLTVAQNYVKWPIHELFKLPGKFLLGNSSDNKAFQQSDLIENARFGINPLMVDVNADGKQDVVWVNTNGVSVLHINKTDANFLAIRLPDTVKSAGAKIQIDQGGLPTLFNVVGQGLGSDPTTLHTIGLDGSVTGPLSATVYWSDGEITKLEELLPNLINKIRPGD